MDEKEIEKMWAGIVKDYIKKKEIAPTKIIPIELIPPKEIVKKLDEYVVGQEKAKIDIAIAVWNRLLAANNRQLARNDKDYYFEKSNILLLGNTGCGKTLLVKSLAKILPLPISIQDATAFTSAGYVGKDIEQCLVELIISAARVVTKKAPDIKDKAKEDLVRRTAEHGIIYVDEADKIRTAATEHKDVNGRSVQEGFLKLIEGTEIKVKSDHYRGMLNTKDILFIFGGSFPDLDKIILKRYNVGQIGFISGSDNIDKDKILSYAKVEDFITYGMIPELLGRLPVITTLDNLDKDKIRRIFIEPKNCILSQIQNEFKSYGVNIDFNSESIDYIVDRAVTSKLGARGLKGICQELLRHLYYVIPSASIRSFTITREVLIDMQEDLDE